MDASGCRRPVTPRERAEARRTVRGISLVLGAAALHLLAFAGLACRYGAATATGALAFLVLAEGLLLLGRAYARGSSRGRRVMVGSVAATFGVLALAGLLRSLVGWLASVECRVAGLPSALAWLAADFWAPSGPPSSVSLLDLALGLAFAAGFVGFVSWMIVQLLREAAAMACRAFLAPVAEDPAREWRYSRPPASPPPLSPRPPETPPAPPRRP